MLVSGASDECDDTVSITSNSYRPTDEDDICNYDTANELFDIMSKTHRFQDEALTASDLIVLYKNLDVGTKLMTEAKSSQTRPSNQYVENIVYKDEIESEDSDIGEFNNTEDIRNLFMINSEQMDLLDNNTSINSLCHKYCKIDMSSSIESTKFDNHFIFKDPYIRDQIKGLMSQTNQNDNFMFPSSLLDYICCKRLEDNCNFYMDNIIRYVQNTIEHLKRISNGDYLTDRAKEKWREVNKVPTDLNVTETVLTNSISIPLRVERKLGVIKSTWDGSVHSEVDVRTLSKILKRKLILEIPRIICGSYKMFSQNCTNNLIISYKNDSPIAQSNESRVEVVLKLKKSDGRNIMSKIDPIVVLEACTSLVPYIQHSLEVPSFPSICEKIEQVKYEPDTDVNNLKISELDIEPVPTLSDETPESVDSMNIDTYEESFTGIDTDRSNSSRLTDERYPTSAIFEYSGDKSYNDEQTEANFSALCPDELGCNVQRLNMQSPVPEENEVPIKKKESTMRVRIKSPYENSSHVIEEKKRRRLLEIRERRENKKKVLHENAKISKHKHSNTAVTAQASNSVTKLSITNKSFYNSIYGQVVNETKSNLKNRKVYKKDLITVVEQDSCEGDTQKSPRTETNPVKYINHSYYLDDADTEVNRLQMKQLENVDSKDVCTASTSAVSDDFSSNSMFFKHIINANSYITNPSGMQLMDFSVSGENNNSEDYANNVPMNTPKVALANLTETTPSVECRKSIDKLYDLIKKNGQTNNDNQSSISGKNIPYSYAVQEKASNNSIIQPSDSGTSIKHQLASSIPSCFSFEKKANDNIPQKSIIKNTETPVTIAPKIVISNKTQPQKSYEPKGRKERKRSATSTTSKVNENPLKAISQLLHQFDNVQKSRLKIGPEAKTSKKLDSSVHTKNNSRQVSFKKPLSQEHQTRENETLNRAFNTYERKAKLSPPTQPLRSRNTKYFDENQGDKFNRHKISDIIDEVKEARGEAVRGPKLSSRLDSLAQPKKSYIQSRQDQYQSRFARNIPVNKPKFVVNTQTPNVEKKDVLQNLRTRQGRMSPQKLQSSVPPIGSRRSASSSPVGNRSSVLTSGPPFKYNALEAPITKKMVAVESYVKNHYGRVSSARELVFNGAQTARVPLIPTDLDIGSVPSSPPAEESHALGMKLHSMIYTMLNAAAPVRSQSEIFEVQNMDEALLDNVENYDDMASNTDFPIDVLGDKHIATVVSTVTDDDAKRNTIDNLDVGVIKYDIQPFNSTVELAKLETALYRRLSGGNFQKRLRIKNLTLTPKHSLQQVLVLQSGDAASLMMKSTLSRNLKGQTMSEINIKTVNSQNHVDYSFVHFPLQVATVAYAAPNKSVEDFLAGMKYVQKNTWTNSQKDQTSQPNVDIQSGSINVSEFVTYTNDIVSQNLKSNESHTIRKNEDYKKIETKDDGDTIQKVDNVTSLDILVGLLNEIKNITSCQTNITHNENNSNDKEIKQLELINYKGNSQNSGEKLSTSSLDVSEPRSDLKIVRVNALGSSDVLLSISKPLYVDKEITVDNLVDFVDTFTNVPSRLFPGTTNHSTYVTNSIVGLFNEPSDHSTYSIVSDYKTLYSNSSFNKIIDLSQSNSLLLQQRDLMKLENTKYHQDTNNSSDTDHMLRTKRDILVTVYSLLVFTVFAALSLPDILYLQYM